MLRSERRFTQFSRSLSVPDSVKEDDITASLTNGVLEVTIPKAEPARAQPKRIAVQTGGAAGAGAAPKVTHTRSEGADGGPDKGAAADERGAKEAGGHEAMAA